MCLSNVLCHSYPTVCQSYCCLQYSIARCIYLSKEIANSVVAVHNSIAYGNILPSCKITLALYIDNHCRTWRHSVGCRLRLMSILQFPQQHTARSSENSVSGYVPACITGLYKCVQSCKMYRLGSHRSYHFSGSNLVIRKSTPKLFTQSPIIKPFGG